MKARWTVLYNIPKENKNTDKGRRGKKLNRPKFNMQSEESFKDDTTKRKSTKMSDDYGTKRAMGGTKTRSEGNETCHPRTNKYGGI